jgi:threonine/homoserine/homoserine lactone efflux protein
MLEFFFAALVIGIAPGPDNLFVLAQSATYGARRGFYIILGLCTGIALQICLLVAGVSALIAASPTAFFVIQCLGAAYLLYLAYKSFQVRAGTVEIGEEDSIGAKPFQNDGCICHPERNEVESKDPVKSSDAIDGVPSARSLYMRGIIMNMTNPKVILFILSLIPPAVRLDRPIHPSLQTAIFGAEFIVATMIVFGSIALLAGTVKKYLLTSPKANRNLNWFSGCVFVLLAIALFFV